MEPRTPNPAAEALLAALNEAENGPTATDAGDWKTTEGWAVEWGFKRAHASSIIRRLCRAGMMETRMERRSLGQVCRPVPVHKLTTRKAKR